MFEFGPVSLSRQILTNLLVVNNQIQYTRLSSYPCSCSLQASLLSSTLSKAPFTFIVKRVAFKLLFNASSTLCIKHVIRLTANCNKSALNCQLAKICKVIASYAILHAISFSNPLLKTKSSAISLYDFREVQSALLGFRMIARIAVQKAAK